LRRKPAGDTLPDTELVLADVAVDRIRLASYDRVCGFRLGDTLAVTYPHVLAFPLAMALMSRPDFPLPLVGLVHIANRIEQHRPIGADERIELRVRAADLRPHDRGQQVDLLAEAFTGTELVWTGRSTYLHRSTGSSGSPARPAETPPRPTAIWRVGRRVGPEYAEVSGDRNPIHTSRLGARLFGFPRPIAHGMWSKARCLAALEGRLPDAYTVEVAFKLPILLPATVGYSAVAQDGGWRLDVRDAKSGKPHLSGSVQRAG
jgi:acyl dehydratase